MFWNQGRTRRAELASLSGTPLTTIVPLVGWYTRLSSRMKVLFPAPERPTTATLAPDGNTAHRLLSVGNAGAGLK